MVTVSGSAYPLSVLVQVTEEELRQAHALLDEEVSSAEANKRTLLSYQEQAARELVLLMSRAADQVNLQVRTRAAGVGETW